MPTDPVQAAGQGVPSQAATLNQAQFMKLLLAQLTNQDPLKPTDNTEFVAQMAQFSSLAQVQQTNTSINALLVTQQASQAIALMGKTVVVSQGDGSRLVAQVVRLTFEGGEPRLTVRDIASSSSPEVPNILLSQVAGVN